MVRQNEKAMKTGVFSIKKPQERNVLFCKEIVDRSETRRKGEKVDFNKYSEEYKKVLNETKASYYNSNQKLPNFEKDKEEYFLPDIKDYHRIIERGMQRLQQNNYDDWSMLVKLCFDQGSWHEPDTPKTLTQKINTIAKENKVHVGSIELMRFHPFFNKLSYYAVKDFLQSCNLIKLRLNQLLYRQADQNLCVYIILFGKLVLHHRSWGGLGVLSMGNCVGEETMIERNNSRKKDAVYAASESYLLEFDQKEWPIIKNLLFATGNKSDFI